MNTDWQKKFVVRTAPGMEPGIVGDISYSKLLQCLLKEPWQQRCQIIVDYLPPHPRQGCQHCKAGVPMLYTAYGARHYPAGKEEVCQGPATRPAVVVQYGEHWFLRYSNGPQTGTFWDMYGEDFMYPELAIVELSKSQPPPSGKPFIEFKIDLHKDHTREQIPR